MMKPPCALYLTYVAHGGSDEKDLETNLMLVPRILGQFDSDGKHTDIVVRAVVPEIVTKEGEAEARTTQGERIRPNHKVLLWNLFVTQPMMRNHQGQDQRRAAEVTQMMLGKLEASSNFRHPQPLMDDRLLEGSVQHPRDPEHDRIPCRIIVLQPADTQTVHPHWG